MQSLLIPLISSVAEHESLVSSTIIALILVSVDRGSNVGILCLDVKKYLTVIAIEANIITSEANLLANIASNLLEVHLFLAHASLTKKNDLITEDVIRHLLK